MPKQTSRPLAAIQGHKCSELRQFPNMLEEGKSTIPAKIITDVNIKLIPKQYIRIKLRILRILINSKTINPHENYRRYRYYRFSYGRGAHIQAFTFSSQDHCRLSIVHVSQAFTFLLTKTLSRSRSVVWCVVCGVGGVWVVLLWWCVCVVCCEAWHSLSLSCSLSFLFSFPFAFLSFSLSIFIILSSFSFFFFSCSFSYSCSCSCSFSFSSLSLLLATKHYGKNRSTNTAANIEAFECDLAQGKCTAIGSLPPPLPSLLPSPPPLLKKRNFLLQEYFRRGNYFVLQFQLIQKNQRRVK